MQAIDPQPGRARVGRRRRIALLEQRFGETLRRLERAGAKPLAWFDRPLGGTVLGQELAGIELECLLEMRDDGVRAAAEPRHACRSQCFGELDQVHLGVRLDRESVGIALPHEERRAAATNTRLEPRPKGGDGDVKVARTGVGIGVRPERGLQDLAVHGIARMDGQQPEHGTHARLDRSQVDRASLDGDAEAAEAANAQRRYRATDPDGNHVLRRGRGGGQRREAAFRLHRDRQALILGGALGLDFGEGEVGEVARTGRAAIASEILRLERRLARLRGTVARQTQ